MESGNILIKNNDLKSLEKYLKEKILFDYHNISKLNIVLVKDNYKIIDGGYESNIVILRLKEEGINIEIYSGGGEYGGFLSMGSESDFIYETRNHIINYTNKNNIEIL